MAKRRRKSKVGKRRTKKRVRKNPFVTYGSKGTRAKRIGSSATREERLAAVHKALDIRRKLRHEGNVPGGVPEGARAAGKKHLRKLQRAVGREKSKLQYHKKKATGYEKKGWIVSTAHETPQRANLMARREKIARKKEAIRRKKAARKRKAAARKRHKKGQATRKRNTAAKAARARKRAARKAAKAAKKAARKAARKPRRNRRKGDRKPRRRRRVRHNRRKTDRNRRKGDVQSNPRRRKKHKHRRKARRHSFLKNPFGGVGSMGDKIVSFLVGGDKGLATQLFIAPAVAGLVQDALAYAWPGFAGVVASVENTLNGISPQLGGLLGPIMPNLVLAIGAEAVGQQFKKPIIQKFGAALMFANIIDLGEAVGALASMAIIPSAAPPAAAAATPAQAVTSPALSGVDFTMGRRRGFRGVDFTARQGIHGIPRGLRGLPQGLRAMPSMRGVDFSATPGFGGLTPADRGDFGQGTSDAFQSAGGTLKTNADFGRQMADYGAMPAMRGAHTGDVMYADYTQDADGNDDNSDESNDHCV